MSTVERVVLCAEDGTAIGAMAKRDVHHDDTPLHLAFSCYLFDSDERLLVTRRASTKATWPGVRTNSCCGHPEPGESMHAAVTRRLQQELGVQAVDLRLVVPQFRYRAQMPNGLVENELCPIYSATLIAGEISPDPAEVDAAWWVPWSRFVVQTDAEDPLSPWAARQISALQQAGPSPTAWPTGDAGLLPAAAAP